MFGIINPPSIDNAANTSMAMMMSSLTASNPSLASAASYVNSMTAGMEAVSTWGGNVDLANFPDWSHSFVAENVLYARTFMAQNPDVVKEDGSIDLSTNAPLIWPADLSNAVAAASASASAAAPPATAAASAASAAASAAATGSSTTNGASAKVISTGLLAVVTIAGAFLAL